MGRTNLHETRCWSAADCEDSHVGEEACGQPDELSFSMAELLYLIKMINVWI